MSTSVDEVHGDVADYQPITNGEGAIEHVGAKDEAQDASAPVVDVDTALEKVFGTKDTVMNRGDEEFDNGHIIPAQEGDASKEVEEVGENGKETELIVQEPLGETVDFDKENAVPAEHVHDPLVVNGASHPSEAESTPLSESVNTPDITDNAEAPEAAPIADDVASSAQAEVSVSEIVTAEQTAHLIDEETSFGAQAQENPIEEELIERLATPEEVSTAVEADSTVVLKQPAVEDSYAGDEVVVAKPAQPSSAEEVALLTDPEILDGPRIVEAEVASVVEPELPIPVSDGPPVQDSIASEPEAEIPVVEDATAIDTVPEVTAEDKVPMEETVPVEEDSVPVSVPEVIETNALDEAPAVEDPPAVEPTAEVESAVVEEEVPVVESEPVVVEPAPAVESILEPAVEEAAPVPDTEVPVVKTEVPVVEEAAIMESAPTEVQTEASIPASDVSAIESEVPIVEEVPPADSALELAVEEPAIQEVEVPAIETEVTAVEVASVVDPEESEVALEEAPISDSAPEPSTEAEVSSSQAEHPVVETEIPVAETVSTESAPVEAEAPAPEAEDSVVESETPVQHAVETEFPATEPEVPVVEADTPVVVEEPVTADLKTEVPVVETGISEPVIDVEVPPAITETPLVDSALLVEEEVPLAPSSPEPVAEIEVPVFEEAPAAEIVPTTAVEVEYTAPETEPVAVETEIPAGEEALIAEEFEEPTVEVQSTVEAEIPTTDQEVVVEPIGVVEETAVADEPTIATEPPILETESLTVGGEVLAIEEVPIEEREAELNPPVVEPEIPAAKEVLVAKRETFEVPIEESVLESPAATAEPVAVPVLEPDTSVSEGLPLEGDVAIPVTVAVVSKAAAIEETLITEPEVLAVPEAVEESEPPTVDEPEVVEPEVAEAEAPVVYTDTPAAETLPLAVEDETAVEETSAEETVITASEVAAAAAMVDTVAEEDTSEKALLSEAPADSQGPVLEVEGEGETTVTNDEVESDIPVDTSNGLLTPSESQPKHPKSPWTPSYSVTTQGPGTAEEIEQLEQLPPAGTSETETESRSDSIQQPAETPLFEVPESDEITQEEKVSSVAASIEQESSELPRSTSSLSPPADESAEERPKSPWTPSYSVTNQGNVRDEAELAQLEQLPPQDTPSLEEPATETDIPLAETTPVEEHVAIDAIPQAVPVEDPLEDAAAFKVTEAIEVAPVEEESDALPHPDASELSISTGSLSLPDTEVVEDRPKSPWTPSYSVTNQGNVRDEEELEQLEQLPSQEDLPSEEPTAQTDVISEVTAPVEEHVVTDAVTEPLHTKQHDGSADHQDEQVADGPIFAEAQVDEVADDKEESVPTEQEPSASELSISTNLLTLPSEEALEERPKSPWTPSYSVTTQGNINDEQDLVESEQLPPQATQLPVDSTIEEQVTYSESASTEEPVVSDVISERTLADVEELTEVHNEPPVREGRAAIDTALETYEHDVGHALEQPLEGPQVLIPEETTEADKTTEPVEEPTAASLSVPQDETVPERPKSPWTPSYSVTRQGPGASDEELAAEEAELEELESLPERAIDVQPPTVDVDVATNDEGTDLQSDFAGSSVVPEAPSSPQSDLSNLTSGFATSEVTSISRDLTPPASPRLGTLPPTTDDFAALATPLAFTKSELDPIGDKETAQHSDNHNTQPAPHLTSGDKTPIKDKPAVTESAIDNNASTPAASDDTTQEFPTIDIQPEQNRRSLKKPSLPNLAPVDEDSAVVDDQSLRLDIPSPTTTRTRLESTTSSRFFPGGWFSATPKSPEGRPSLDNATGEFVSKTSEESTISKHAAKPQEHGETQGQEVEVEGEKKSRWCTIM